jgi:hypothetical protein
LIHSVGSVANVKFVAKPNNGFTGILGEGGNYGIIRFSVAKAYDSSKSTAEGAYDNFAPGLGLKFLRNGVPSANLVAMFSVDGQKSWNIFANDFTTFIPMAEV